MINPMTILFGLVFVLGVFASGLTVGMKWEEGKQAAEELRISNAVTAANAAAAEAISQIKVVNKTIQGEVRREVETHTVYSDCRLTPVGVQLANQALDGIKPAGDLKLPRFDAAGK